MTRPVLLIEDSADNRGLIREIAEWMDFPLIEADNGMSGLEMAREHHPRLILLDLSLPLLNGWEVAARLKADPRTAAIPIIALTAHAMEGDEEKARAAGCNDYVTKPISVLPFQELLSRYLDP